MLYGTPLLDRYQVAELLGVSVRTLERWRNRRTGPPFVRISHNVVRYPEHSVQEWLERRLYE